jgi:hypothetical protein
MGALPAFPLRCQPDRARGWGGPPGGQVSTFDARDYDVVTDQRTVCAYDLLLDETRISLS